MNILLSKIDNNTLIKWYITNIIRFLLLLVYHYVKNKTILFLFFFLSEILPISVLLCVQYLKYYSKIIGIKLIHPKTTDIIRSKLLLFYYHNLIKKMATAK